MLEQLMEWSTHPRLGGLLALGVGFYILRDVIRVFLYLFDSSHLSLKRRKKNASPESRKQA